MTSQCSLRLRIALVAALTASTTVLQAAEQSTKIAGLSVTIWSREGAQDGRQPTVIFSHGFHGCSTQSRFLMNALADAGYLVIAPNHRDAGCRSGAAGAARGGKPEVAFQQPAKWDDSSYRDRADDIRLLIDAVRNDDRLRARADLGRLALAGHSLGGYTVLGLAGAWPGWKLGGVKAVLALSPYTQPFDLHQTLAGVTAPVMYQGGTRDFGITPALHKSQGAYDLTPEPKYYVEFTGATHFAWTNLSTVAHDSIVAYSLAFLNHYVKGEAADAVLTRPLADVAVYRYASELGNSGPATGRGGRASRPHGALRASSLYSLK